MHPGRGSDDQILPFDHGRPDRLGEAGDREGNGGVDRQEAIAEVGLEGAAQGLVLAGTSSLATAYIIAGAMQVARWGNSLAVRLPTAVACGLLCSEDMQDGQRIHGVTIRNPFEPRAA